MKRSDVAKALVKFASDNTTELLKLDEFDQFMWMLNYLEAEFGLMPSEKEEYGQHYTIRTTAKWENENE